MDVFVNLKLDNSVASGTGSATDPYNHKGFAAVINMDPGGPSTKDWFLDGEVNAGSGADESWAWQDFRTINKWKSTPWGINFGYVSSGGGFFSSLYTPDAVCRDGKISVENGVNLNYGSANTLPINLERMYIHNKTTGFANWNIGADVNLNDCTLACSGSSTRLNFFKSRNKTVIFNNCIINFPNFVGVALTTGANASNTAIQIIDGWSTPTETDFSSITFTRANNPVMSWDSSYTFLSPFGATPPLATYTAYNTLFNWANRYGVGAVGSWAHKDPDPAYEPSFDHNGVMQPGRTGYVGGLKFVLTSGVDDIKIKKIGGSCGIGYDVYLCILPGTTNMLDSTISPYRDLSQDIHLFNCGDSSGTEISFPRSQFQNATGGQELVLRYSEDYFHTTSPVGQVGRKELTWYSGDKKRNTTFHNGGIDTAYWMNQHASGIARIIINPDTETFAFEDWNDGDYNEMEGSGIISGAKVVPVIPEKYVPPEIPAGDMLGTLIGSFHPHMDITINDRDISTDQTFETAILISIGSNKLAEVDDALPDTASNRQGWWADKVVDDGDFIGSKLWLLDRAKMVNKTLERAEEYIRDALQWLIDDAIAADIKVATSFVTMDRMVIEITITRPTGTNTIFFKYFFNWRQQILRRAK